MVHFHSSCKISGQNNKMPRNESKSKISAENECDFPLYFHLYLRIRICFKTPQFRLKTCFGYFKSKISKWKKCHIFQVIEIFQAWGISKYFLTPTKKHNVLWGCSMILLGCSIMLWGCSIMFLDTPWCYGGLLELSVYQNVSFK